jgi:hypothetical protein
MPGRVAAPARNISRATELSAFAHVYVVGDFVGDFTMFSGNTDGARFLGLDIGDWALHICGCCLVAAFSFLL